MSTQLALFDYGSLADEDIVFVQHHAANIKSRSQRLAEDIVEIGTSLQAVKAKLDHGQFSAWIETEFNMSHSSANNFMNVAARFKDRLQNPNALGFFPLGVLYELAPGAVPDDAIDQAVALQQAGEPVTRAVARELADQAKEAAAAGQGDSDPAAVAQSGDNEVTGFESSEAPTGLTLDDVREAIVYHQTNHARLSHLTRGWLTSRFQAPWETIKALCDQLVELGELEATDLGSLPYKRPASSTYTLPQREVDKLPGYIFQVRTTLANSAVPERITVEWLKRQTGLYANNIVPACAALVERGELLQPDPHYYTLPDAEDAGESAVDDTGVDRSDNTQDDGKLVIRLGDLILERWPRDATIPGDRGRMQIKRAVDGCCLSVSFRHGTGFRASAWARTPSGVIAVAGDGDSRLEAAQEAHRKLRTELFARNEPYTLGDVEGDPAWWMHHAPQRPGMADDDPSEEAVFNAFTVALALGDEPPLFMYQIARYSGLSDAGTKTVVKRLVDEGELVVVPGEYKGQNTRYALAGTVETTARDDELLSMLHASIDWIKNMIKAGSYTSEQISALREAEMAGANRKGLVDFLTFYRVPDRVDVTDDDEPTQTSQDADVILGALSDNRQLSVTDLRKETGLEAARFHKAYNMLLTDRKIERRAGGLVALAAPPAPATPVLTAAQADGFSSERAEIVNAALPTYNKLRGALLDLHSAAQRLHEIKGIRSFHAFEKETLQGLDALLQKALDGLARSPVRSSLYEHLSELSDHIDEMIETGKPYDE